MRGKANLVKWLLCVLFLPVTVCTAVAGEVIYVDAKAAGLNIGISWENAINSLHDALLLAYFSEKPVEIRVAQGIYTPDRGIGIMPGDREASFQLVNGVTIKGGYAANLSGRRGEPDVRDINQYKSILSGDLNANDGPDLNNIEDNSYHVVTASGINETAVLDGFTITGSGIAGSRTVPYNHSGGMYNDNSSPTLIDCTFTGNLAAETGAGMYNNSSNPVLLNCTFSGNDAPDGGSGMYNYNSSPMLTNCKFIGNRGGGGGAGMYNVNSNPMLADCTFSGNSIILNGGGMYNESSNPALLNCIFTGNTAGGNGGGMYNDKSSPTLTNCTFNENSAHYGGAIHCIDSFSLIINNTILNNLSTGSRGGGIYCGVSSPTVVNTILWNNSPDEIYEQTERRISTSITVTYSDVKGGFPGEGNLDIDPMFADPENGDFHLKSQAGRWDQASESWVIDETSSPCIDAGSPDESVGLERFPNGDRVNMGAYGGTPEASLSPQRLPGLPGQASNPRPANGAVDVEVDANLSWAAGLNAVFHDVYFGTDRDAVADADTSDTTGIYRGRQATTSYTPPEGMEWGTGPYCWRIDEVNREGEIISGTVWSFTTVPPPPPPKGRVCFLADTPVWVDRALVQISKVVAGQTIGKLTCLTNTSMQIEKLEEHEGTFVCYDVLLESGKCISVADCHYFLTESGRWVSLQNLKTGTKLQTAKGSIGIISVNQRPMPYVGKVFNLKVEGTDRYPVGEDAIIVRDY